MMYFKQEDSLCIHLDSPMKNCSAMLCTRICSNGITHNFPKLAASFKVSTSCLAKMLNSHSEGEMLIVRQLINRC